MYNEFLCKKMNSNFRVKFNSLLVGYSGLVLRLGSDRANLFISKALRSSSQCKRFNGSFGTVCFYAK